MPIHILNTQTQERKRNLRRLCTQGHSMMRSPFSVIKYLLHKIIEWNEKSCGKRICLMRMKINLEKISVPSPPPHVQPYKLFS